MTMRIAVGFEWMFLPMLLTLLAPSWAGSVGIMPVIANVEAPASTATYLLKNTGSMPLTVQISGLAWTQDDCRDVVRSDPELIIVPPLADIIPGATQVIRVARPDGVADHEMAYRIHFEEISNGTTGTNAKKSDDVSLNTELHIDVPLFFTPVMAAPHLTWAVKFDGIGRKARVEVDNRGNRFERFNELELRDENGVALGKLQKPLSVLASSRCKWEILMERPVQKGHRVILIARSGGVTKKYQLIIE